METQSLLYLNDFYQKKCFLRSQACRTAPKQSALESTDPADRVVGQTLKPQHLCRVKIRRWVSRVRKKTQNLMQLLFARIRLKIIKFRGFYRNNETDTYEFLRSPGALFWTLWTHSYTGGIRVLAKFCK